MIMVRRLYDSVAHYKREFPHVVMLPNAGGWRAVHALAALCHLSRDHWHWWTVIPDFSSWGFKDAANAAAFKAWADTSSIDWRVKPTEQRKETRPPPPTEGQVHSALSTYRIETH
jgi:hypothetical protein